jgi:hypothetical protein
VFGLNSLDCASAKEFFQAFVLERFYHGYRKSPNLGEICDSPDYQANVTHGVTHVNKYFGA